MKSALPRKEELLRKLLHFSWVFLALAVWWVLPRYGKGMVLLLLIEALGVLLLFDFVRVEWKWPWLQGLIRKEERGMFCGATTGMLGVVLAFALVNPYIACLATLFMGIGDLAAGFARFYAGKHLFLKKTWEDFLAGFVASSILGLLLVPLPLLIIPMALIAQMVENATGLLDDNILMVLSASLVGQILYIL